MRLHQNDILQTILAVAMNLGVLCFVGVVFAHSHVSLFV